ncbi:MAG: hypothetical protein MUC88_12305, partial [Planctomycetes bacterium]|nr:hypothetical protein [Planctomycetota bacterium]
NNGSVGGMGYFCAYDNSRVTINGGGTELRARHNSQVTINGGQICPLITSDNSRVIMNGGDIGGDSFIRSSSPLIVNGGSTGCLFGGQVIVNGGQIRGVSGTLCTFVGSDFAVYSDEDGTDLVFSGYGNFAPSSGTYWLWGTLATGDLLAGTALYFDVCAWGGGSDVSFVPLPGAVLLGVLGLSVAGWRLRRRA